MFSLSESWWWWHSQQKHTLLAMMMMKPYLSNAACHHDTIKIVQNSKNLRSYIFTFLTVRISFSLKYFKSIFIIIGHAMQSKSRHVCISITMAFTSFPVSSVLSVESFTTFYRIKTYSKQWLVSVAHESYSCFL